MKEVHFSKTTFFIECLLFVSELVLRNENITTNTAANSVCVVF